jgi:hypothetical protein
VERGYEREQIFASEKNKVNLLSNEKSKLKAIVKLNEALTTVYISKII